MIAVIVSGHGGFATGMQQAIEQVIGEQPQFGAIDFTQEMSTAQLERKMSALIAQLDDGQGIAIMTDLLGGSPFRTASLLCQQNTGIEVITGANLQMIAELLLEREELTLTQFREQAIVRGRRGITSLADELLQSHPENKQVSHDGI